MRYKIVYFDVDGTLCDPGESMIECAKYALERMGVHEEDNTKLNRLIGPPLEHAFRDYYGFDEDQTSKAVTYFREMMQGSGIQLYRAYDGLIELLDKLHAKGVITTVVTSKIDHIAIEALKATGMLKYFDVICSQKPNIVIEKKEVLREALEKTNAVSRLSDVVMIGDRKHDVEAANAHRVDSIGVLWGYGSRDELENEGATHIVQTVSELERYLLG